MYLILYNEFTSQHLLIHKYVGAAPTTSELSTSLLPTKAPYIKGLTVVNKNVLELYGIWMADGVYWRHNWK